MQKFFYQYTKEDVEALIPSGLTRKQRIRARADAINILRKKTHDLEMLDLQIQRLEAQKQIRERLAKINSLKYNETVAEERTKLGLE